MTRCGAGILCLSLWAVLPLRAQPTFSVASYNVKNYLLESIPGRKAKPEAARLKVQETLLHACADVVVLQEMGKARAMREIQNSLGKAGLDYPYAHLMQGYDRAIRLGLLSRFPIGRMVQHTNDQFLVENTRQWVRRGFLEAEIEVSDSYRFTVIAAHLKSKFQVPFAREAEIRRKESVILRRRIESRLMENPDLNLLVLGDLNDTPDSVPVRTIIGRGKMRLHDAKPHEWLFAGGEFVSERPHVNWTYYFPAGGVYSRVDYVLLSRGMKREWLPESSCVAALPYWFEASDHRLLKIGFAEGDR